jgi:DNA polymerase III subunit epsilon
MREIVLDTETTGLDPAQGHRVVEIGCVELFNSIPTGHTYHVYLNPERDMPEEAQRVHGLSAAFLKDKPLFVHIVDEFLTFIGNDQLVIHNAEFDVKFLNAELKMHNRPVLSFDRVLDTLALARRRNPGASNSLDALCNRYNIDNSRRTKHGALLDSEILAEVYAELLGGRQSNLGLSDSRKPVAGVAVKPAKARSNLLPSRITLQDRTEHEAFIAQIGDQAVWNSYFKQGE